MKIFSGTALEISIRTALSAQTKYDILTHAISGSHQFLNWPMITFVDHLPDMSMM